MAGETTGNVRVICRFRPMNEKEIASTPPLALNFSADHQTVVLTPSSDAILSKARFQFDHVFPPTAEQIDLYEEVGRPLVEAVMQGFNGTILAYGQTSSGKTYTMTGPDVDDEEQMGLIPRMVRALFEFIECSDTHIEFTVKVSYAEIYLEKIRDLLDPSKTNLKIHEDRNRGVFIGELTETYVGSDLEILELMKHGLDNREVGSTQMNAGSSRSHSIFIMTITQTNALDYSSKVSRLYLVDLAGSEKIGKTGAEGKRLEEAKNINMSLTTLGHVINSLTDGKSTHVPYRDSKLTRVLQDSLGGNSKTALIITCSPAQFNEPETVSTLRFGVRAKAIKNKPKVNREFTVAELKLMLANVQSELAQKDKLISQLHAKLVAHGLDSATADSSPAKASTDMEAAANDLIKEEEEIRARLSEEVEQHSSLKTEYAQLETAYHMVFEELNKLKRGCEDHLKQLEDAENRAAHAEDLVAGLVAARDQALDEVEELNKKLLSKELASPTTHSGLNYKEDYEKMKRVYDSFKASLDEDQLKLLSRVESLEDNLVKLTNMYYQLVSQRSILRADREINQKRMARLRNNVKRLETELKEAKEQHDLDQQQINLLVSKIQNAASQSSMYFTGHTKFLTNIRKAIKGGGASFIGLPPTPKGQSKEIPKLLS